MKVGRLFWWGVGDGMRVGGEEGEVGGEERERREG